jgi:hypothetical protein
MLFEVSGPGRFGGLFPSQNTCQEFGNLEFLDVADFLWAGGPWVLIWYIHGHGRIARLWFRELTWRHFWFPTWCSLVCFCVCAAFPYRALSAPTWECAGQSLHHTIKNTKIWGTHLHLSSTLARTWSFRSRTTKKRKEKKRTKNKTWSWKVIFTSKFVLFDKQTPNITTCMSSQGRHFGGKTKTCGNTPQRRTGLVKFNVSL